MAAGEAEHPAVARGIAYLLATQKPDGLWDEEWYTAVGFPARVLSALSRLPRLFPALGAGALSPPGPGKLAARRLRDLNRGKAAGGFAAGEIL